MGPGGDYEPARRAWQWRYPGSRSPPRCFSRSPDGGRGGVSGRQADGIALGIANPYQPVSLVRALLLGIEPHALVAKTADQVVEVINCEIRRPSGAWVIADAVG